MARAQAHTLEALTASLVLVAAVVFVIQTTAAPLAASSANQEIGTQQRGTANTMLSALAGNGSLERAVTDWSVTAERWPTTSGERFYTGEGPPNAFGETLNETFINDQFAVNVDVVYRTAEEATESQRLVFMGTPSENAVRANRMVVLHNDTRYAGNGAGTVGEAAADGGFYMPDAAPDRTLFNVAEVRITVWRN